MITKILLWILGVFIVLMSLMFAEGAKTLDGGYGTVTQKTFVRETYKYHRGIMPYNEFIPAHYEVSIQIGGKTGTITCLPITNETIPIGKKVWCEYYIGGISGTLIIIKWA